MRELPSTGPPLAAAIPAAVAAGLLVGGCQYMKAPWTPRTSPAAAAPADTARAPGDTAAGGGAGGAARTGGADPARPDSVPRDTALPEGYPSAAELEEKGPTYTEYDVGPRLLPGPWLPELLRATLAPVVDRNEELSVEDFALFWVLVDREGEVRDVVLHTSSRSRAFDRAARAVAERLRYRPAIARARTVPVWVLARISLLMR